MRPTRCLKSATNRCRTVKAGHTPQEIKHCNRFNRLQRSCRKPTVAKNPNLKLIFFCKVGKDLRRTPQAFPLPLILCFVASRLMNSVTYIGSFIFEQHIMSTAFDNRSRTDNSQFRFLLQFADGKSAAVAHS